MKVKATSINYIFIRSSLNRELISKGDENWSKQTQDSENKSEMQKMI